MVTFSVLYPKTSDSQFDHDYYTQKHMPLVRSLCQPMGLVSDMLFRGITAPDGTPPGYELLGFLTFESAEKMEAALAATAAQLMEDIPRFTNVTPLMQWNAPVAKQ